MQLDDIRTTNDRSPQTDISALRDYQAAFGYTHDELENLIEPMTQKGKDPVGSMGDDTPLSVLTEFNRPLFSYFKQLFAQVTNPPLDYIREELVTSMESRLGFQRNLLDESPAHARQLVLDSPILTDAELESIRDCTANGITAATIDITYEPRSDEPGDDLEAAIERVRRDVVAAIEDDDHDVIVLSDRNVDEDRIAIPSLLATGGVHHHLVRNGLRNHVGLVVESADPRTVHHFATLVGYGAGAVNPYLAYRTIEDITAGPDGADTEVAIDAYVGAVEDGLLKIMAKMGISTVESYQGARSSRPSVSIRTSSRTTSPAPKTVPRGSASPRSRRTSASATRRPSAATAMTPTSTATASSSTVRTGFTTSGTPTPSARSNRPSARTTTSAIRSSPTRSTTNSRPSRHCAACSSSTPTAIRSHSRRSSRSRTSSSGSRPPRCRWARSRRRLTRTTRSR